MSEPSHFRLLLDVLSLQQKASFGEYPVENWDAAADLAMRSGIAALFFHRSRSIDPRPDIPSEIAAQLRRIYLASVVRMERQFREYGRVLGALREAGIPVMVLKGGHLGPLVYRNIAVRAMCDMDILVREGELSRAAEVLSRLDYRSHVPHQVILNVRAGHHWNFVRPGKLTTVIEIHWLLCENSLDAKVDYPGLWERAMEANIAGVPVFVMSPPDLLLHLCLHSAIHTYDNGLRMTCDIAEVLRVHAKAMDWDELVSRAHRWNLSRGLFAGLWLARQALCAPVPEAVLASLAPAGFDAGKQNQLLNCILQGTEMNAPSLPGETVGRLWATRGWHRKASFILQRIFLPAEDMAGMYPAVPGSMKILLYYPVRIRDILRRHGRMVWGLLKKESGSLDRARRQNESNSLKDWLLGG